MSAQAEALRFTVLIPARLASTRLPHKPLLDIAGLPMVVRVAERVGLSQAQRCVVATDDARVVQVCQAHGVSALLTDGHHASGTDRLAQASALLGLSGDEVVVNVQGDEPLIDPALIDAVAVQLQRRPDCAMSTAAHPINTPQDFANPNVVKVVLDKKSTALYFSRAPIAHWRDGPAGVLPAAPPLRHIGIYAYRSGFLQQFSRLELAPPEVLESLEQLRVLWHGHRIAVHVSEHPCAGGVDTPEDLEYVRQLLGHTQPG